MSAITAAIASVHPVLLWITVSVVAGIALTLFAEWAAEREAAAFERNYGADEWLDDVEDDEL